MGQEISNPHDKLFKQLLGEPENAASFLENNLPGELVSHLDLSTLGVVHASFIDAQFIQSEADLLFSVTIANRPGYVYVLFEHQSSPDPLMLLRLLGYMVGVWKRFQRESPPSNRLPVIIPMVLFHGSREWQGSMSFQSLVDMPAEVFAVYTPDFSCKVYDLSPFGKDEIAGNAVVRILGDILGAYGRRDFKERVRKGLETLNELMSAPGFARVFEILFRYILQVYDIPKEEIVDLLTQTLKPDVEELIMTTYEQLLQEGEQIGLQKGEQIGLQKGAGRVLARLLLKRFDTDVDHLTPLLNALSPEQQDELSEKILVAQSLDEIHQWLKSVCSH